MAGRARPRIEPADAVRAVLHEIRSRIGAIRLAVSAMQQDASPELRAAMLATADRETLRVSTELSAVTALVACLTDRSRPAAVDVTRALRKVGSEASRRGTPVRVRSARTLGVRSRVASLDAALTALVQLVADGDGGVTASASRADRGVLVRLERDDGGKISASAGLIDHLLRSIGAGRLPPDGTSIAFVLPQVRS